MRSFFRLVVGHITLYQEGHRGDVGQLGGGVQGGLVVLTTPSLLEDPDSNTSRKCAKT